MVSVTLAGLLVTPRLGPGHGWQQGRQVVDQATEQIKLVFPLRGARTALSTWVGGCSGLSGSASCPGSDSLRGKEPFTSPLAAAGTARR